MVFLFLAVVLVLPVWGISLQGGVEAAPGEPAGQGACLAWNIDGEWQYRASLGGYGTMNFIQDPAGNLAGSWYNAANGASGSIKGDIEGAAVHFIPSETEAFMGTVAPDGKKIVGTFTYGSQFGTWDATGVAECTRRQPAPSSGTAQINVRWGPHLYRRLLRSGAGAITFSSANQPQLPPGVPVITFLGQTSIEVEVIYFGEELPNSLVVFVRVEGQDYAAAPLVRVEETPGGGVLYRGVVNVSPQGTIAPGQRQIQDVMLINPWGEEVFVSRFDMNLIDPSGYIYDAQTNERLEGAIVSCFVRQGGNWLFWDAETYGQENPLVSNDEGHYGWDVPQGDYKVRVSKPCYQDAESAVVTVPPPRTDVHFALQPLACSPVTIADVWTADSGDIPATEFRPGQEAATHIVVNNTGTGDVEATIIWSGRDPGGALVQTLTGSGEYIVQPGNAIDVKVGGTVPGNAQEGVYSLTAQLTYNEQTSVLVTQFQVVSGAQVFLPSIMTNYAGEKPPGGITGRVTEKGAPAANIPLELRYFNGSAWSTRATTKTNGSGVYLFEGIPSLAQEEVYYVRYGPNDSNPARLYYWFGPDITSYSAGSQTGGGDFDIADVVLLAPEDEATVALPVTFSWKRRGIPGEGYRVVLFDLDSADNWMTEDLGDVGSVTIGSLPGDIIRGKQYGWYGEVYAGPDSFGMSYYFNRITFQNGRRQTENSAPAGFSRLTDNLEKHGR